MNFQLKCSPKNYLKYNVLTASIEPHGIELYRSTLTLAEEQGFEPRRDYVAAAMVFKTNAIPILPLLHMDAQVGIEPTTPKFAAWALAIRICAFYGGESRTRTCTPIQAGD